MLKGQDVRPREEGLLDLGYVIAIGSARSSVEARLQTSTGMPKARP